MEKQHQNQKETKREGIKNVEQAKRDYEKMEER